MVDHMSAMQVPDAELTTTATSVEFESRNCFYAAFFVVQASNKYGEGPFSEELLIHPSMWVDDHVVHTKVCRTIHENLVVDSLCYCLLLLAIAVLEEGN